MFLLPLAVVSLSLVLSMGIMGLLQMPLTLVTQILPSFLLVIGITDSVHILTLFFRSYDELGDKREAIAPSTSRIQGLSPALTIGGNPHSRNIVT